MNIGLIVLGLAFLFFLVVAYFASKTWHWGHVVAMAFLFLFTLIFLFMTATLMRTQNKFRPQYSKAVQDYENAVKRERQLKFGDPSTPAGPGTLMGERRLAQAQHATVGRNWGNVFAQVTPQQIQLDMRRWTNEGCQKVGQDEDDFDESIEPVADPESDGEDANAEGVPAGVASEHGILQNQYVYAFHEYPVKTMTAEEKSFYFGSDSLGGAEFVDQDQKGMCRVPGFFLGKFIVLESTPQRLSVAPADQLTKSQSEQLAKTNLAWSLYEKLPTDTHDLFAGVDPAKLPALLPLPRFNARGIPMSPAAHRTMIEAYARDGKEVAGRVNNPLRVRQVVEFVKEYEQQVDLDIEGELPKNDDPFDDQGRAQVRSLMQQPPTQTDDAQFEVESGRVKFKVGAQVTLDGALASVLIDQGFAKPVGQPVFARQLRDYQFLLNNFHLQFNEVAIERNKVEGQVNDLTASLKRLQEQIEKHEEELGLLRADQKGFEIEREQLEAYKKTLEQRLSILQGEVSTRSFATR